MPRTHGYSMIGKPCYDTKNWQARGRINVIGALCHKALINVGLFDCNINADVFHAWVKQQLMKQLTKRTVIVMDNATFHKRQDTQNLIKSMGHILEYLPPYSPDLNPIEHKWAQAKALRKKLKCSTQKIFKIESILFG